MDALKSLARQCRHLRALEFSLLDEDFPTTEVVEAFLQTAKQLETLNLGDDTLTEDTLGLVAKHCGPRLRHLQLHFLGEVG